MGELCYGSDKTVLIASSSLDAIWQRVAQHLSERGYDVLAYEADKVADGSVPLEVRIDDESALQVCYDSRVIALGRIASAWYRRPTMFAEEQPDKAYQISVDRERTALQYSL